ncbi:MAG: carbohydrate-binding domain-containing protein [Lachnospiraceae bacterium]|nr:carbohydrate-binding domain-containing protein [Lachnospiraceae bacterium]
MRNSISRFCVMLTAVSFLLSGCARPDAVSSSDTVSPTSGEAFSGAALLSEEDLFTEYDTSATLIVLDGDFAEITGNGALVSSGLITITSAGTYVLSGSFQGQVLIDAGKKDLVHLILNGASIACDHSAAIYGSQSKKIILTLADDTVNSLSDGVSYIYENAEDDEPNAAFFSKDDITLNGSGTLLVNGCYADGIRSKDSILIISGTYEITAKKDGIQGKDALYIADGSFTIDAGKDALKSSNSSDTSKGFVTIDGGIFEITCGDDAFHAETALTINNGKILILSCYEGLEGLTVEINDGQISITSEDDGINAAGGNTDTAEKISVNGMELPEDFGRQGFGGFGGGDRPGSGGNERPDFDGNFGGGFGGGDRPGGGNNERPDFDGNSDGGFGGGFGGGGFGGGGGFDPDGNENACITINGGTIYVNAGGDGIDSNGYFYMNGGTVYVEGPENNGNGALDYAYGAEISGGTILAIGASGMAMGFGENSSQPSLFLRLREWQTAGAEITLSDGEEVLFSYTSQKSFNSIVLSLPDLEQDVTYTLTCGTVTEEVTVSGNRTGR